MNACWNGPLVLIMIKEKGIVLDIAPWLVSSIVSVFTNFDHHHVCITCLGRQINCLL